MQLFTLFAVKEKKASLDGPVVTVLEQEMKSVYSDQDPETLNRAFLERFNSSVPHRHAGSVKAFVSKFW